jgi:predicted GNAT family acetyltransferase
MGVGRSILFTGRDNAAARRAYESIGYRRIGDYGLVVL